MSIVDELGEFEKPRVQVSGMPHVSEAGMRKINECLRMGGYSILPEGFPKLLESRMGKMPTRVQRYMQAYHGERLSAKELETVGNLADRNVNHGKTVVYDFTRDVLTWPRGSFGNNSSCWRTSHASSIPMFNNGIGYGAGFTLRVFMPSYEGTWYNRSLRGYGRCWCMPIDKNAVLTFNPYGDKMAVFSSILIGALPDGSFSMRNVRATNSNEGIYMNGEHATLIYETGSSWETSGDEVNLNMRRYYTSQCRQCGERFGSVKRDQLFCRDCAVPCVISGSVVGSEMSAYVENVSVEWQGKSIHIVRGHIDYDVASKVLDFCYACMSWHGSLDECDAGQ